MVGIHGKGAKMNFANVDWVATLINWLPMLLIIGIWIVFFGKMQKRGGLYSNQARIADAMERIAAALEKQH
jgi:ATP-dependent Zn protease